MRAERSATSCSTRTASSGFGWVALPSITSPRLGRRETRHAVGADAARELSSVVQIMQVRDRLAEREEDLPGVELALEEHLEHVGGGARRLRAGRAQLREALGVVGLELGH